MEGDDTNWREELVSRRRTESWRGGEMFFTESGSSGYLKTAAAAKARAERISAKPPPYRPVLG